MMNFPLQIKPYMLDRDEGKSFTLQGASIRIKASSEMTGGAFNLFDVACPPGFETPIRIHYSEDVAICVLEGALMIYWGNEKKAAAAGSFFFQPRGTPHGFRVKGSYPARFLCMTIPAGLDKFVVEQEIPSPKTEPAIAAARYKIEILGPLPE